MSTDYCDLNYLNILHQKEIVNYDCVVRRKLGYLSHNHPVICHDDGYVLVRAAVENVMNGVIFHNKNPEKDFL